VAAHNRARAAPRTLVRAELEDTDLQIPYNVTNSPRTTLTVVRSRIGAWMLTTRRRIRHLKLFSNISTDFLTTAIQKLHTFHLMLCGIIIESFLVRVYIYLIFYHCMRAILLHHKSQN
jgi:hypothetical protein